MSHNGEPDKRKLNGRNRRTTFVLVGIVICMGGLAFAAVPLYQIFCQVTGYGGTPQVASALPDRVLDREVTIRFNADHASNLPWDFEPAQRELRLKVGESGLAFYSARNNADHPVTGMAIYNVTPLKAGEYFTKIDCFCFTEQRLAAGQQAEMPVSFFVDPDFAADPEMDDVRTITLSYTFYNQTEEADAEPSVVAAIKDDKNQSIKHLGMDNKDGQ